MDLYELFENIKKRPGMFLGHASIKNLFMLLQRDRYFDFKDDYNSNEELQSIS